MHNTILNIYYDRSNFIIMTVIFVFKNTLKFKILTYKCLVFYLSHSISIDFFRDEDLYNPVKKLNFVGEDSGLSLVVKENDSDVAYIRGPGEGVEVYICSYTSF